jgi:predicted nucleotidyltransferase
MLKTVEPTKLKKEDVLKTLKEYKSYLRERFGVKEIGLFGSFAREEQTEGSDIDILVDVERNKMGLVSYVKLKLFLEELFGRKVDLVTKKALRPELKETILREVVYV